MRNEFCLPLTVIRIVAGYDNIPNAQIDFGPMKITLNEIGVLECHFLFEPPVTMPTCTKPDE